MKKLIALVLIVLIVFGMTACTVSGEKNYTRHTNNRLVQTYIDEALYYDPNTRIVYIIFNEACGYNGYGYMSPYYTDNGLPYVYNVERNCLEEISK